MTRSIVASALAAFLFAQGCHLTYSSLDYAADGGVADATSDAPPPLFDSGFDGGETSDSSIDAAGIETRDLRLSCTGPRTVEQRGDPITMDWVALNDGTVPVPDGGSLVIEMLQPPLREGEPEAWVEMATDTFTASLVPTEAWSSNVTFPTPDWVVAGENRLRCSLRLDIRDDVPTNDTVARSLVVTGLPDLAVTFIGNIGATATEVAFTATIDNLGTTAARDVAWTLRGRAGGRTISLANGTITYIPRAGGGGGGAMGLANFCPDSCLSGTGELVFEVDPADNVRESDEANNAASSAMFTW